jgi:CubicO group peptidase (beta-lactamase class C family)
MEDLIRQAAEKSISERTFPGCVVGIVRKNGSRSVLPFGRFTYEKDAPVVEEHTLYDTASITKSIPTASLALQLIDEGKLRTTDRLIDYVPEFNNSDREQILIRHLLTYTLDGYGFASSLDDGRGLAAFQDGAGEKLLQLLLTRDFERRPGTVFRYTNIPAALLGLVIERICGETLDELAASHFFKPLGMNHSTFYPEKHSIEEIPPTEIDSWRGEIRGIVHDESAWLAKKDDKIFGHAGLFSTASDILTFMEMLLNGGELKGEKFFSEEILAQMETNQIPELNDSTGLGWELNQPRFMGKYCTPKTFGKTGFTGTACVIDRSKETAYVILSNRTYPQRSQDSTAINAFRAAIGEIVFS